MINIDFDRDRFRDRALAAALAASLALIPCTVLPEDRSPLHVVSHLTVDVKESAIRGTVPTHRMRLSIAVMRDAGWRAEEVLESAQQAATILGQCGIRTGPIDLYELDGPKRYRSLFTPVSRELAKQIALPKPTIFFVADTLNQPAFDAEAVGRGNSRSRPEMADTVWIASGARDLPVVIAHELAHVLADSGRHSNDAGNLMREETSKDATQLTAAQCEAIVDTAGANGLLKPLH